MAYENHHWYNRLLSFVILFNITCFLGSHSVLSVQDSLEEGVRSEIAPAASANISKTFRVFSEVATSADLEPQCTFPRSNKSGMVISHMMRLRMRSMMISSTTLFEDVCRRLPCRNHCSFEYCQLVYLRFCDVQSYKNICNQPISGNHRAEIDAILRWWMTYNSVSFVTKQNVKMMDKNTNASKASITDFHCQQISYYFTTLINGYEPMWSNMSVLNDSNRNKTFDFDFPFANPLYKEVYVNKVSFCGSRVCGVASFNDKVQPPERIDCYPALCKTGEIALIAVYSILGFVIVVTNLLVLVIAAKTNVLRNTPGYFKVQLAIADFFLGVVVLPQVIYVHYVEYFKPLSLNFEGDSSSDITISSGYSKVYLNVMGIFSVLSLNVSGSTLCAASVDRYLAITKPLWYTKNKAFMAKVMTVVLGSVFSTRWILVHSWFICGGFSTPSHLDHDRIDDCFS